MKVTVIRGLELLFLAMNAGIFAGVLFIIYNITVILTSLLSCFDYYRKDICPALKPNPKKSAKAQMWLLLLQPLHEEMLISI